MDRLKNKFVYMLLLHCISLSILIALYILLLIVQSVTLIRGAPMYLLLHIVNSAHLYFNYSFNPICDG